MSAIVTAAEMRAAEQAAIEGGTPAAALMERAGRGAAEAIRRFAGPLPALVLAGPGNNGGDGYVIARHLAGRGVPVRVAALSPPTHEPARTAHRTWGGTIEPVDTAEPAPLLIDALFGTGLDRPLDQAIVDRLAALADSAVVRVAIDLPSGASSDDGRLLSPVPEFDLTVAFAALKPSHLLQPSARHMGRIAVADIGIEVTSRLAAIPRPRLTGPGPDDHKYQRGSVLMFGGDLPGAAGLAATAAMRVGAGSVRLMAEQSSALPLAIMQGEGDVEARLADDRVGAIVLGPGLIPGEKSAGVLLQCLAADRPLVLDAGAITLLVDRDPKVLQGLSHPAIVTPHPGEFQRLFGSIEGDKVAQAREAARRFGAVIVSKGADTVVAAPDGRAAIARDACHWLATAGSGDVLAGVIAAMRAVGMDAFAAAQAGVWLHIRAATIAGPGLIADDLVAALRLAYLECL